MEYMKCIPMLSRKAIDFSLFFFRNNKKKTNK